MSETVYVAIVADGGTRLYRYNGELQEYATLRGEIGAEDAAKLAVQLSAFLAGALADKALRAPLTVRGKQPALPTGETPAAPAKRGGRTKGSKRTKYEPSGLPPRADFLAWFATQEQGVTYDDIAAHYSARKDGVIALVWRERKRGNIRSEGGDHRGFGARYFPVVPAAANE